MYNECKMDVERIARTRNIKMKILIQQMQIDMLIANFVCYILNKKKQSNTYTP